MNRTKNYLFALITAISIGVCATQLTGCNGSGSTVTGNPTPVNPSSISGKVYQADGTTPASEATVFVPTNGTGGSLTEITVDCGANNGGTVSCGAPPQASCASTCSCADGSYSLDLSKCTDPAAVEFSVGNSFASLPIENCPTSQTCDLSINLVPNNGVVGNGSVMDHLVDNICQRMNACNGISTSTCVSDIQSSYLDNEFGLPIENRIKVSQIRSGLETGSILVHQEILSECQAYIKNDNCNSFPSVNITSEIENIFGPDSPCGETSAPLFSLAKNTAADEILSSFCDRVIACGEINPKSFCLNKLENRSIGVALGLDQNSPTYFSLYGSNDTPDAVRTTLINGNVVSDSNAAISCQSAISNLSCTGGSVPLNEILNQSYDLESFFPGGSCLNVLSFAN